MYEPGLDPKNIYKGCQQTMTVRELKYIVIYMVALIPSVYHI